MIDDDLLLPLLCKHLAEANRTAVLERFFQDPSSRQELLANANFNLANLKKGEPLRLHPGEPTGDWRDSHEGLGGGVYPASVNAGIALPALSLSGHLILAKTEAETTCQLAIALGGNKAVGDKQAVELDSRMVVQRVVSGE